MDDLVFSWMGQVAEEHRPMGLVVADFNLLLLAACAKKGVPANVANEIKAWSGSKQSLHLCEAIFLEGQDSILPVNEIF